jgi:acetylornithine deacetylase
MTSTTRPTTLSTDLAKDVRKLLAPFHGDLVRLLRELVRVDTVAIPPNGSETRGQFVLRRFLAEQRIRPELYEVEFITRSHHPRRRRDRNYRGRKNLVARLTGSGRGRSLLLNGHMDTVPPGRAPWSGSPWSGEARKGRLYGLGSFDMKAGLAAQAIALCALKRGGVRLGGDLILESVVDEEWGGGGGTLAGRLRGDSADACVISESTQLEVYRATRGGFVVDLEVEAGDPTKYFSNQEVLSPAVPLGRLLGWVDSWAKQRHKQKRAGAYAKFSDPAPVQVLAVESNHFDPDVPLSVPSHARLRLYFQFLPRENVHRVIGQIHRSLLDFERKDVFFRAHPVQWKPLVDPPLLGHELALDHPWTRCLIAAAMAGLGREPIVTAAPYPCDAFLVHREFGIPTLLFGPCGAGAHNPDEYVELKSVIQTAEVLVTAAMQWCAC